MKELLRVVGLEKRYGPGCPTCVESTGPERDTNICPWCGSVVALAAFDLEVFPGETVGIVGESGSGKSTALACIYQDLPPTAGAAYFAPFEGGARSTFEANSQERRALQMRHMGMVYQSPALGLSFHSTAGANIVERLLAVDWREVSGMRAKAGELLWRTEVPMDRLDAFPGTLSGGMQQRVQIARALANEPPLLLLDELTTGLDVSVQAGVIDLIRALQQETGAAMVMVSHDLAVIRLLAPRSIVMRLGHVVERGLTDQILEDPQHPYTQLLVSSTA
ncbi:MAG: ATP-binding cassette domain-containing protein [Chloroflexi bacterium]|nr:ATP-binding cassette domain-containing protein [Chloroflexota bacterium]